MTGRRAIALLGTFVVGAVLGYSVNAPRPPRSAPAASPDVGLREEVANLQQLRAVDREAQAVLRRQIADLTAKNGDLNSRLLLLQRVLVPDGLAAQLGVADLALTQQPSVVEYRVLIARTVAPREPARLTGRVELMGVGQRAGQEQQIRLAQAALSLDRVQTLRGKFVLPEQFEPQQLRVVITPNGQSALSFDYPWHNLIDKLIADPR